MDNWPKEGDTEPELISERIQYSQSQNIAPLSMVVEISTELFQHVISQHFDSYPVASWK